MIHTEEWGVGHAISGVVQGPGRDAPDHVLAHEDRGYRRSPGGRPGIRLHRFFFHFPIRL